MYNKTIDRRRRRTNGGYTMSKKDEKIQLLNDIEFLINYNSNFYDVIVKDGKYILRDLDDMKPVAEIQVKLIK